MDLWGLLITCFPCCLDRFNLGCYLFATIYSLMSVPKVSLGEPQLKKTSEPSSGTAMPDEEWGKILAKTLQLGAGWGMICLSSLCLLILAQ